MLDAWYEQYDSNNDLSNRISLACEPSNYERRTLAVRLEVPQVPTALQGVVVDYTVHGVTKTLRTNLGIAMCRGDEQTDDVVPIDDGDDNVLLRCFEEDG